MALPANTYTVLRFLNPGTEIATLVDVSSDAGVVSIDRYDPSLGTQPTEQQINDAATDQPGTEQDHGDGAELFSAWEAKHGGNDTLTNRKTAADMIDATTANGIVDRELIEVHNKRINYLTNRLIGLQNVVAAMIDSSGSVGNMRTDGATQAAVAFPQTRTSGADTHFATTATRTRAEAITDYKTDINAGNVDT